VRITPPNLHRRPESTHPPHLYRRLESRRMATVGGPYSDPSPWPLWIPTRAGRWHSDVDAVFMLAGESAILSLHLFYLVHARVLNGHDQI
jgi:hypothetical protein